MTVDVEWVGVGVACALFVGGAIWKAGGMRSEVVDTYQTRTDLASAGLDERAADELRRLADRVDEVMGRIQAVSPSQAIQDPSELEKNVATVNKLLRARQHLPRTYVSMTKTGPRLVPLLVGLLVSAIIGFSYFAGFHGVGVVGYVAMSLALAFLALSIAIAAHYLYLLHRFSGAEILSAELPL